MMIKSRDNEKIKRAVKLVSSAKYRRETGRFAIEGARLCSDAAESGIEIFELYYTERAYEKYRRIIDNLLKCAEEAYLISEDVSDKLCDTQNPQGVYCICGMRKDLKDSDVKLNGKLLGLEKIQDPSNLGAVIRTAAALGIDLVVLDHCCDVYNPKALRSSMGAILKQNMFQTDSMSKFVENCNKSGIKTCAAVLSETAVSINEIDFSGNVLTVIGNEGNGITEETARSCKNHIIIPMKNNVESMNAAVAAGIIIWAEVTAV